jgi:hypothetical protein
MAFIVAVAHRAVKLGPDHVHRPALIAKLGAQPLAVAIAVG